MGCASVVTSTICQLTRPSKQWVESNVGILAMSLLDYNPEQDENFRIYSNKLTDAKFSVSNQTRSTKVWKTEENGVQSYMSELITFIINSCYRPQGRLATIEGQDKTLLFGDDLGRATFDLDAIIGRKMSEELDCELYKDQKAKGTIKIKITFLPQPYQIVSFMFIDAFVLSDRNPACEFRKIFIRVQIGEEILETEPRIQGRKNLPHWEDNVLKFRVPDILDKGIISVYEIVDQSFLQIGKTQISLPGILSDNSQKLFIENINLQNQVQITGNIKFCTLKGENKAFQPLPSYRYKKEKKKIFPENEMVENENKPVLQNIGNIMQNNKIHLLKTES